MFTLKSLVPSAVAEAITSSVIVDVVTFDPPGGVTVLIFITFSSLEVAVKLAKILDTSVDYLLGNDDDMIQSYYELSQRDKDTVSNVVEGLKEKNNN